VHSSVIARLEAPVAQAEEAAADESDDVESAGPLTLAIDLKDDEAEPAAAPSA